MNKAAFKITTAYFITGFVWIFFSDHLLSLLSLEKKEVQFLQSVKGGLYVAVTSLLLYYLVNRYSKSLIKSTLQYKKLFEENPNPMWVYDTNTLEILKVNKAAVVSYGYSEKEFLSMTIKGLRSQDNPASIERLQETIAKLENQYHDSGIWEHQKKNGKLFYVHASSHPTTFEDRPARLVLALDVHEKYLADQKILQLTENLKEREAFLNSLIDSQSNFLIRIDLQGNYSFVNKAFCRHFGYEENELLGQPSIKTITSEDVDKVKQKAYECMSHPGRMVPLKIQKMDHQGRRYITSWEFVGITNAIGAVIEVQAVGQDVTQEHEFYRQLIETKEKLESILSTVHDVVRSFTAEDQEVLFINQACEKVAGYTQQEFYENNQLWKHIIVPEDLERVRQVFPDLYSNRRVEVEYRIRHQDGTIRYIHDKLTLAKDSNGIAIINGVATDVTSKKMAEVQAKENTKIKEDILESITDAFFAVDHGWNFIYANKEFEKMLFVRREDVLGKNVWELFPETVNLMFYSEYQRAVKDNISVKFEEYLPSLKIWFKVSAYPTKEGLAIYFQDITLEKELALKIERSERNLSALINNTQDLIWSVDADLRLLSANKVFLHRAEKIPEKGDEILKLTSGEMEREKWKRYYQKALAGEHYRIEEHDVSLEGNKKFSEVSFNPIVAHGKVIGVSCITRDITESKKNEERIQWQNQKLSEIAHVQSHGLRKPVATIMGLVALFDEANISCDFNAEIVEKIGTVCNELDTMIRQIVENTQELDKVLGYNGKQTPAFFSAVIPDQTSDKRGS